MKLLRKTALSLAFLLMGAFMVSLSSPLPAQAQDKTQSSAQDKDKGAEYVYSPDNCEFQVTLPSAPHKAQRCKPENPADCHDVTSFTHVFGLDATVDIRLTCNKAETDMYERYSGDVMRTTLESMVGKNNLGEFESYYQKHDEAKQAVLIGSGASGNNNKIYMAQLWIGKTSVLTIEGELIGGPHAEADDMFADILKSTIRKTADNAAGIDADDEDEDEDSETDAKPDDKQNNDAE